MIDKLRFIEQDINRAADEIYKMQNKIGTRTSLIGQDLSTVLQNLEEALVFIRFAISDLEDEENGQR